MCGSLQQHYAVVIAYLLLCLFILTHFLLSWKATQSLEERCELSGWLTLALALQLTLQLPNASSNAQASKSLTACLLSAGCEAGEAGDQPTA